MAHAPTWRHGLHARRSHGVYLFTVSRLDAPKRVDLLIRAMRHVRAPVQLRISGTGPQEPQLRELAAGDSRIVLTGFLTDEQLADAYAKSFAVLFAPLQEDYGYITLEAMLSGKPVITTTDSGGPTELVQDGVNGLIVPLVSAALGAAVERLLSSRRNARRMGRVGLYGLDGSHGIASCRPCSTACSCGRRRTWSIRSSRSRTSVTESSWRCDRPCALARSASSRSSWSAASSARSTSRS